MERRLLFIVNPISGTSNKTSVRELIQQRTAAAGFEFGIYPSVADGDYTYLHDIIREKSFTDVIIAGGDGTINQVIQSLRVLNVRFGILPCGSGNGLAFSAGLTRDLDAALDVVFTGREEWTDAFLINDSFACMLCGLGFDAQVAHDFANDPRRGLATYVKQTLKNFFKAKAYTFKISTAEKEFITDAFFISIANSNQFGNNFKIAPKASLTDGKLDIVIMTKQTKLGMLFQAAKQVSGFTSLQEVSVMDEKGSLLYFQTENIIITNAMEAPLHIDGDPVETMTTLRVRLLHRCFRLLYPHV